MMFTVYGPGINDPIHLEKLFAQGKVPKVAATTPKEAINAKQQAKEQRHGPAGGSANQRYRTMPYGKREVSILRARQVMTSPVISIQADASMADAVTMLENGTFRHIPVLAHDHQLVGMLSDRDILQCMCGSSSVCLHCSKDKQQVLIDSTMTSPVLTANINTDARHIARLFVEQKIGAIPIMDENALAGIISRSDILRAVMSHFSLELWA